GGTSPASLSSAGQWDDDVGRRKDLAAALVGRFGGRVAAAGPGWLQSGNGHPAPEAARAADPRRLALRGGGRRERPAAHRALPGRVTAICSPALRHFWKRAASRPPT